MTDWQEFLVLVGGLTVFLGILFVLGFVWEWLTGKN